jgi:hypothetical protein
MAATQYVILQEDESGFLQKIGEAEGNGDRAAILAYAGSNSDKFQDGKYYGVPKRSWTPHDIKRKVKFG